MTNVTGVWLFASVCSLVNVEVGLLSEAFVTDVAGERPIPNVSFLVLHQFAIGWNNLAAVITHVRRLSIMPIHGFSVCAVKQTSEKFWPSCFVQLTKTIKQYLMFNDMKKKNSHYFFK